MELADENDNVGIPAFNIDKSVPTQSDALLGRGMASEQNVDSSSHENNLTEIDHPMETEEKQSENITYSSLSKNSITDSSLEINEFSDVTPIQPVIHSSPILPKCLAAKNTMEAGQSKNYCHDPMKHSSMEKIDESREQNPVLPPTMHPQTSEKQFAALKCLTVASWYKSFQLSNPIVQSELDRVIQSKVNFYCNSCDAMESYGFVLKTQPTKFLSMYLLKSMFVSEQNLEQAINDLFKIKSLFNLYDAELKQFYDTKGFLFLIEKSLAELYAKDPLILCSSSPSLDKLSSNAANVVIGAQLYVCLLLDNVSQSLHLAKKLRSDHGTPEWYFLCCSVQHLKRLKESIPIVKPKKTEMDFLRAGLASQPQNVSIRILACLVLFDWMRTDDRKPQVQIYGEILQDVADIGQFLHQEIQDLLSKSLPQVYALELYILASSFYGYRNLPLLLTKKFDTGMRLDLFKLEENGEDVLDYYNVLTRDETIDLSEYYSKLALSIQPKNAQVNMFKAFKCLRKFCRDEALQHLRPAFEEDSFNENLILFYIRILIGGNQREQEEAFMLIDKYTELILNWSRSFKVHLYFLKGSLFWFNDQVKECVQAWIQGLYVDPVQFLNQFSFWSKTQIRKHLWPDKFSNFQMIDTLKKALSLLSNLAEENFEDPRIPSASAAFLREMDFYFPATWNMTEEIAMLSKKWFYLLDSNETQNCESQSSSEEDEEARTIAVAEEEDDDIVEVPFENTISSVNEPSVEYMDLEPAADPKVWKAGQNVIKVNILPDFYVAKSSIPQLNGNPAELITLD